jgi:hypothetical protein
MGDFMKKSTILYILSCLFLYTSANPYAANAMKEEQEDGVTKQLQQLNLSDNKGTQEDTLKECNPDPKSWYKIVNKQKFFENKSKGAFLTAGKRVKDWQMLAYDPVHCSPFPSNNDYAQWRFNITKTGHYIINKSFDYKDGKKYLSGNSITLESTPSEWILKQDANKDAISPQFFFVQNKNGLFLSVDYEGELRFVEKLENKDEDKIKWMFFK